MKQSILSKDGVSYVVPFILITSCFALWGFANDITNPMVKAFSKIFRMSATDGALVQVAFYGGYFAMAFPAAIFIRRFSYKAGVLVGLGLYALGAFLFYPAKMTGDYYPFLLAYFILTCGLSFLETSSNPYVLSMGTEETATRRLNLAQSFNPMGSLLGMYVAMNFIQARLNPMDTVERSQLSPVRLSYSSLGAISNERLLLVNPRVLADWLIQFLDVSDIITSYWILAFTSTLILPPFLPTSNLFAVRVKAFCCFWLMITVLLVPPAAMVRDTFLSS